MQTWMRSITWTQTIIIVIMVRMACTDFGIGVGARKKLYRQEVGTNGGRSKCGRNNRTRRQN